MFVFLFLAFVASFAIFNLARDRLKTPLIFNLLGSFCVWACFFSLGGAMGGAGPWSPDVGGALDLSSYKTALKYFALASLAYGGAYALQHALAKRHDGSDKS